MAKAPRLKITVINLLCLVVLCGATESPQYEVVHAESDFEIRHYRDATWMSATVNELSFQKATLFGFHRYHPLNLTNLLLILILCQLIQDYFLK